MLSVCHLIVYVINRRDSSCIPVAFGRITLMFTWGTYTHQSMNLTKTLKNMSLRSLISSKNRKKYIWILHLENKAYFSDFFCNVYIFHRNMTKISCINSWLPILELCCWIEFMQFWMNNDVLGENFYFILKMG